MSDASHKREQIRRRQEKTAQIRELISRMPDASLREAATALAREDPVFWAMYYRRLRGKPLIFDNSGELTDISIAKLRKETGQGSKNRRTYLRELKRRLLRHRPFLMQPLRDDHPHKVYMKARQMGVSELSLIEETWFLENHPNTKWIRTFPREANLKKFVATRIDPTFEETPRMRGLIPKGAPDGLFTKRIKDSFLIMGSAWESALGEGVDADGITLDERDRMNPGVERAFKESLKSSAYGLYREVSTPSLPDRGVGLTFSLSDQLEWLVRCMRCGLEQEIKYPDNVVQMKDFPLGTKELPPGSYAYLCRLESCRGKLDRLRGRWVARKPDVKNIRGYHMSHLMCPWLSATNLMQDKIENKWPDIWMKYCLGLPAIGEGELLSEMDYEMACSDHDLLDERGSDWTDVVVGIDWGHLNWIVVEARNVYNDRRYVIGINVFEDDPRDPLEGSAKAAERYLAPFAPDLIMADDGYGKDRNAYLRKRFDGSGTQFFAVRYSPAPKNTRQFRPVWNEEGSQVLIDRTMWLKVMMRSIKARAVGLPSYGLDEGGLLKQHLKALRPMREVDDQTKEVVEVVVSNGPDHLAHCMTYCELAYEWLESHGRLGLVS